MTRDVSGYDPVIEQAVQDGKKPHNNAKFEHDVLMIWARDGGSSDNNKNRHNQKLQEDLRQLNAKLGLTDVVITGIDNDGHVKYVHADGHSGKPTIEDNSSSQPEKNNQAAAAPALIVKAEHDLAAILKARAANDKGALKAANDAFASDIDQLTANDKTPEQSLANVKAINDALHADPTMRDADDLVINDRGQLTLEPRSAAPPAHSRSMKFKDGKMVQPALDEGLTGSVQCNGDILLSDGKGSSQLIKKSGAILVMDGNLITAIQHQPAETAVPSGDTPRMFKYDPSAHKLIEAGKTNGTSYKWTGEGKDGHWQATSVDGKTWTVKSVSLSPDGILTVERKDGGKEIELSDGTIIKTGIKDDTNRPASEIDYPGGSKRTVADDGMKMVDKDGSVWVSHDGAMVHLDKDGTKLGESDGTIRTDASGNITWQHHGKVSQTYKTDGTTVKHDQYGQVSEVDYANGTSRKFEYAHGMLVKVTDTNGQVNDLTQGTHGGFVEADGTLRLHRKDGGTTDFNTDGSIVIKDAGGQVVEVIPSGQKSKGSGRNSAPRTS